MNSPASDSLANSRIGIVGTGVMAEAMLTGMLREKIVDPRRIVCSHPRPDRRGSLETKYGVRAVGANVEAARGADIVLLAVKPQVLPEVMASIRSVITVGQLVISVIAGAPCSALCAGMGHDAVIRAMPNTPSQIGAGVTVWYATPAVDATGRAYAAILLGALGREFEVGYERQVAMATAVSGTGPTYIFLFIEALVDAAVRLGFPRHVARELVLDTIQGSAAFAVQSGRHVAELRDMVTSPGGTSSEALYQLERGGLRTVVSDAVRAAFDRTLRLEETLERSVTEGGDAVRTATTTDIPA